MLRLVMVGLVMLRLVMLHWKVQYGNHCKCVLRISAGKDKVNMVLRTPQQNEILCKKKEKLTNCKNTSVT